MIDHFSKSVNTVIAALQRFQVGPLYPETDYGATGHKTSGRYKQYIEMTDESGTTLHVEFYTIKRKL